jgi:hypothetical protein
MTDISPVAGICSVPVAPLRSKPDHGSEQVSQLLMGESFQIEERDEAGEWLYVCCAADGYRGWLRSWYGIEVDSGKLAAWEKRATWMCARTHETVRLEASQTSEALIPLPWGARVAGVEATPRWLEVELADGRRGFLPRRSLVEGAAPGGKPTPRRLLKTAAEFLGVPYAWGGRSSWGMDCSGFVQTVFAWHGVQLPRDSTEQMERVRGTRLPRAGVADSVPAARAGDLLFFGPDDKTATHVAISLGGGDFLHAQGEVRLSSLDPSSELFANKLVSLFLGFWPGPAQSGSWGGPGRETP